MKNKSFFRNYFPGIAAFAAAVVFAVITAVRGSRILALAEAAVILIVSVASLIVYLVNRKKNRDMLQRISEGMDFTTGAENDNFPLPVYVADENGDMIWHNRLFESSVLDYGDIADFKAIIDDNFETLCTAGPGGVNMKFNGRQFSVYSQKSDEGKNIFFFADTTKLRIIAEQFMRTRPAVMLIAIDGMDEIERNYRDSESAAVRNEIERMIEAWLSEYDCMKTKRGENTFAIVTQTGDVESMAEKRFDILDEVRAFTYNGETMNITLSIGVGASGGINSSESQAKQSLEMAFGRGGDQAAVKLREEYEFFGGVSKSVERQTQVKTRIISNAFCELLEGCDNVIVMGHKFPDLDALGSCFGIAAIARSYGKEAYIVTDASTALSKPLIEYMSQNGFGEYIISAEKADRIVKHNTLVVITDTHVKGFMEFPEIAGKASSIVVIDHHRKAVNYIDNALIFYHDPSASSASELVTKMIQYLPRRIKIGSAISDALLSGIMLDTKNFVLRAGVSTFEAAAYLKGAGADTVRVKRLFADTINEYRIRSEIVSGATQYKQCAISLCTEESPEIRIVAAQAADELLNIKGVDASFVIFKSGDSVSISARSFGAVNVQLVMESLGGGGHQTMAAAQFKDETAEQVSEKLLKAIEKYFEK